MTISKRVAIQFCGFGGQGVVLSSIITGSAAAIGAGIFAVQTQSYGSEARGGECQAEVILSPQPIGSPTADQVDILLAMSQMAYQRYADRLATGGILIIDPDMVHPAKDPAARSDVTVYAVPASRIADESGAKITANMVMLGFLQPVLGAFTAEQLFDAIRQYVRANTLELNLKAARQGMALAQEYQERKEG